MNIASQTESVTAYAGFISTCKSSHAKQLQVEHEHGTGGDQAAPVAILLEMAGNAEHEEALVNLLASPYASSEGTNSSQRSPSLINCIASHHPLITSPGVKVAGDPRV